MSYDLIIRPEAQDDLAEAFAWYETRRRGLGADLLLSVEATLADVQRRPESFPEVYRDVRRALTKRFPYGVYFLMQAPGITVIAVFHAKRDPTTWQRRA